MNMPKTIYVFIDRDDEGDEYPVAHVSIEEILPNQTKVIGVYELKELALLVKEERKR